MITMQMIMSPIKQISGINQQFAQFEHPEVNLMLPKLAYFAINLFLLGISLYKFSVMGVIPVTPVDWSGIITPRVSLQHNQLLV